MQCTVREAALSDGKPGYRVDTACSLPQYADARRTADVISCARRYADFEGLHSLLSQPQRPLPSLPGTRLFSSAAQVAEERLAAVRALLSAISADETLRLRPDFASFLGAKARGRHDSSLSSHALRSRTRPSLRSRRSLPPRALSSAPKRQPAKLQSIATTRSKMPFLHSALRPRRRPPRHPAPPLQPRAPRPPPVHLRSPAASLPSAAPLPPRPPTSRRARACARRSRRATRPRSGCCCRRACPTRSWTRRA